MAYVLDGTSERTDYAAMHKAGVVGMIVYPKFTSRAICDRYRSEGFIVRSVHETTAMMTAGGFKDGHDHGGLHSARWEALGGVEGDVVYWADDHAPTGPDDIARTLDYGRGFATTSSFLARGYGNNVIADALVNAGICDKVWQCRAWSGTPPKLSVHRVLYQRNDDPLGLGGPAYDVNDVIGDDWATVGAAPPPTPPPPEVEPLIASCANADGRVEVFQGQVDGKIRHRWQKTPAGVWSDWSDLGAATGTAARGLSVSRNKSGSLEVFAEAGDYSVQHCWQLPAGGWSGWVTL